MLLRQSAHLKVVPATEAQSPHDPVSSNLYVAATDQDSERQKPCKRTKSQKAVWENMAMSTQQKSYEWHTATVRSDSLATAPGEESGTWHFASIDGEHWYGVSRLPEVPVREHWDEVASYAGGTDGFVPMSIAQRGLRHLAADNEGTIVFHEVVRL